MIPIYEPYFTPESLKYAHDAIDSKWVSSKGPYVDKATDKLKEILGAKYVILTNNGTTATHLVAIGLHHRYPHINRIVVPDNVFVAAWNSFVYDKNFKLIPIRSNLETWNFDWHSNDIIRKNEAILFVHNIGNIIDIDAFRQEYPDKIIVEDNCEGIFGKYGGQASGTKSLLSSLSFFGNKTITSGEGGALVTDDDELAEYLDSVKGQGQSEVRYLHDKLGYNYRMTNVQAAILYGQLEIAEEIKEKKKVIFDLYDTELTGYVQFQRAEATSANWMYAFRIPGLSREDRKTLELHLYENYIETRTMFYPITEHRHLQSHILLDGYNNTNSWKLHDEILMLPSFPGISSSQVLMICSKIKRFIDRSKIHV